MVTYGTLLRTFKAELENQEKFKKDTIQKLARLAETEHICHISEINDRIATDLEGYTTRQYVGMCLDKKYKQKKRKEQEKGDEQEQEQEQEQDKKIEVAIDGSQALSEIAAKQTEESRQFWNGVNENLEQRTQESKSLNDVVVKELDKMTEENKELKSKMNNMITPEQYSEMENKVTLADELLDTIRNHLGEFVKFEEDETGELEITEVMSPGRSQMVTIDLKTFEEKIKRSYQAGKKKSRMTVVDNHVTDWA